MSIFNICKQPNCVTFDTVKFLTDALHHFTVKKNYKIYSSHGMDFLGSISK